MHAVTTLPTERYLTDRETFHGACISHFSFFPLGCLLAKLAIINGRGPDRTKLYLRTYPIEKLDDLLAYAKTRLPSMGPASRNITVGVSAVDPEEYVEKIKKVIGER